MSKRILIFGATSAMAQAIARRFAAQGHTLHLVARRAEPLPILTQDLLARGAHRVTTSIYDLDNITAMDQLVTQVFEALGGADIVILAQGSLPDQVQCESNNTLTQQSIHNNFVAPACLLNALAKVMIQQSHGILVAIGSVAGDRGRQSNYVYGSAKAGLDRFLQGLRNRLAARGIHVLTVKPGFVDTPMTTSFRKGFLWATPDQVAQDIERAIERRHNVCYTPWFWRLIMALIRHIPESIFKRLKL
jgi:decaprenylphospho-beta-D-erythro-pentofuranosid-2-ulose 2-reductase